uniref:Uncharacterized protein n=1 Tax=Hucho hucho TaxID=62062 RepID=A0A4W5LRS6_9TELE
MEDGEQAVSSTTEDKMSRYSQYGNHYGNNEATATFGDDDIVDLVGGAHDAIERHKASYPEDIIKFTKDEEAPLTNITERATGQLTHDEVIPDSTPSAEEVAEIIPAPVSLNCLDADSLPELIRPYPPTKAAPEEAGPVLEAPPLQVPPETAPEKEAIAAPPAPSHYNFLPPAALQPLMQFPKGKFFFLAAFALLHLLSHFMPLYLNYILTDMHAKFVKGPNAAVFIVMSNNFLVAIMYLTVIVSNL